MIGQLSGSRIISCKSKSWYRSRYGYGSWSLSWFGSKAWDWSRFLFLPSSSISWSKKI